MNVNAEYRFSRRLGLFTVIRNIANEPLITEIYGPTTPTYARISNYQNLGSQISLGLKGESAVLEAARTMLRRVESKRPEARVEGFASPAEFFVDGFAIDNHAAFSDFDGIYLLPEGQSACAEA